jgi:adenylate cyclase
MSQLPLDSVRKALSNSFKRYERLGSKIFARKAESLLEVTELAAVQPRSFEIQSSLRPLFGKGQPRAASIGDHPDFVHLRETGKTEYCPISTLFMDIEASTKLALIYQNLEDVVRIKNALICAAIEIIQALDGHVHRIMGDAVMAFFGGRNADSQNAAIDAVNCASTLKYFIENVVIPNLNQHEFSDPLGVRIGVDFGGEDSVLWASYGRSGTAEVTATSFYVDSAAKLQQAASRNEIMIGESIRSFLDFPDELLATKTSIRDGKSRDDLYLLPNYRGKDGKPRNYRQHLLKAVEYLRCSPLALVQRDIVSDPVPPLNVQAFIADAQYGQTIGEYQATGRAVRKGKWLRFIGHIDFQPQVPFTWTFKVENHGAEACDFGQRPDADNHEKQYTVREARAFTKEHWEKCEYRGLHYMIVEVSNARGLLRRTRFGVYVE